MARHSDYGHTDWRLGRSGALIIIVLAILSVTVVVQQIPRVRAAASLTIQPASQAVAAAGSTVTFNVTVQSIPNGDFAGWDVYVTVDNTILNPTAITPCNVAACNAKYSDVAGGGNFMPPGSETKCINGAPVPGFVSNCTTGLDGPGIVHDTFTSGSSTTGSLLLFTITYKAVTGPGSTVRFPESTTGSSSQNHLFDSLGGDITASEIGGGYGTTSTSVTCAPSPVVVSSSTTCTTTVRGDTSPTGSVNFASNSTAGVFNSTSCTLRAGTTGTASCAVTYTPAAIGHHVITASYLGDASHLTSSGSFTLPVSAKVDSTSTSVSCAPTPVVVNSGTTCTATVTDTSSLSPTTPMGTVGFTSNSSGGFAGSPCMLSGTGISSSCQATYTPSAVGTRAHKITATYNTDSSHLASSGNFNVTVTKIAPTLSTTLSLNTITVGRSVTDSAALTGSFQAGGTVIYSFFAGSTCSGTGTTVGSPGTVTNGNIPASTSHTFNTAGSFSWNAVYSGDGNNNAATSPCEPLTVNKTTPIVTAMLSSTTITAGSSVTDSASLASSLQAGGTVIYNQFSGSTCGGTATVVSTVTVTMGLVPNSASLTPTPAGLYSFNAVYSGDANNSPATSACEPLTVSKTSPAIMTSLSSTSIDPGGSVTDSATLTGSFNPSGTVTYEFFTGSSCGGSATIVGTPVTVTGGVVPNSISQTFNNIGSFSWNALYSGDGNSSPATSGCEPLTVLLSPASATITASLTSSSATVGQKVLISVNVTNNTPSTQTFTIRAKWGAITVAGQNVTLNASERKPVSLSWDTSNYSPGTANVTAVIPQTGSVQNAGPLTLNSPSPSLLSSSLLPFLGVGAGVVILVIVGIVWAMRRGRRIAEKAVPSS